MHLHINPHGQTPVYKQIQRQIARAIADREIHPGDLLQPQQQLASQLAVSPTAVRKAYRELESHGLCDQPQTGHFRVTTPELAARPETGTDLALALFKREILTRELETARQVQHRFLPPDEICGPGWTVSSRSYAAGALAGDFYDLIERPDGTVDLVVADVAGKGLAAGLIMAATKAMIPVAADTQTPGAAVMSLNQRLIPLLGSREFVALVWARFDPHDGRLQVANAGLPDPYLLRHAASSRALGVPGERLPLGIRQDICYSTLETRLSPGDRLLLLTDGIPEATDADGNPLGYEGLAKLLDRSPAADLGNAENDSDRWLDRFLARVSRRTGSMIDDDWTAMHLEYHQARG